MKILLRLIIVVISLSLLFTSFVRAEDLYYSSAQAGSHDGSSCTNALALSGIQWGTGTGKIGSGDTAHLCGTITGSPGITVLAIGTSGTSGSPITIKFETGALLTNTYWGSGGAINTGGQSYLVIDGGVNGVIQATDNGSITSGKSSHQSSYGIASNGSHDLEIKNITIADMWVATKGEPSSEDVGDGVSIRINRAGSNISIHDCVTYQAHEGIELVYDPGTFGNVSIYNNDLSRHMWAITLGRYSSQGAHISNVDIYNNNIHDGSAFMNATPGHRHCDGIMIIMDNGSAAPYNTLDNLKIRGNYFYGDWTAAVAGDSPHISGFIWFSINTGETSYVYTNTYIYNNIFVASSGNGYPSNGHIQTQGQMDNTIIANNIFVGQGPGYGINQDYNSAYGTFIVENNIFYNLDIYQDLFSNSSANYQIDYNLYYGGSQEFKWSGVTESFTSWKGIGWDIHSINQNPDLNTNYTLKFDSPAVDAGVNLDDYFSTDKDGFTRPFNLLWDIGAYEYAPSDIYAPTITDFNIPSTWADLSITILNLTATDNTGVTGYLITESSGIPSISDPSWSGSAPLFYSFATQGTKTLYAWAKDAAGNVSASWNASVTITLPVPSSGEIVFGTGSGSIDIQPSGSGEFVMQ